MHSHGKPNLSRIAVIQTAFLGDLVLTTPLFRALKQIEPDSYLTVVARPEYREMLRADPGIDECILYDKGNREQGLVSFSRKIRELRVRSIPLAVSPHRSARSAIMLWRARIPRRIGFSSAAAGCLYSDRVDREGHVHEVDRNLGLVRALGRDPAEFSRHPRLFLRDEWREEAFRLLPDSSAYVGIAPSSVWPTKQWLPEGFSRLIDLIGGIPGTTPVLLGDPGARDLAERIASGSSVGTVNLVGRTSLGVLTAVVDRLQLMVSNDSALVHIASARDIPSVVIYGPTVPEFGFGPLAPGSTTVGIPLPCRPCDPHGPRRCPRKHFQCMRGISPDDVFMAFRSSREGIPLSTPAGGVEIRRVSEDGNHRENPSC